MHLYMFYILHLRYGHHNYENLLMKVYVSFESIWKTTVTDGNYMIYI